MASELQRFDFVKWLRTWTPAENPDVTAARMNEVANEIEHLRSLAGAVTDGPSHAQLKRQQGPQEVKE